MNGELVDAINFRDLPRVSNLIEQGANVNEDDEDGLPPLYWAMVTGNLDFVRVLVDAGANLNRQVILGGGTYLHGVIKLHYINIKYVETFKYLVEHGADINAQDNGGYTPLHAAIYYGTTEIIKYLISQGARVDIPDNNGVTPTQLAEKSNTTQIREYFQRLKEARRAKIYIDRYVIGKKQVPGGDVPELPDDVLRKISDMAGISSFGKNVKSEIMYLRKYY
jgi:hypothetical protein